MMRNQMSKDALTDHATLSRRLRDGRATAPVA
jgi:hypothetical protein